MEYLYIAGIIGYYLYKAYSSNKKKQENKMPDYGSQTPQKKKKGLFDEILEEIEKAQKAEQAPKPATVAETVQPKSNKKKKPVAIIPQWEAPVMSIETEGQRVTADTPFFTEEPAVKKSGRFAGMNMSPKEALKAQIILERKF